MLGKLLPQPKRNQRAFTLVEILIVVAIIGVLVGVTTASVFHARHMAQQKLCIANLKQIDSAKHQWAHEKNKSGTDTPVDDDLFGTNAFLARKPVCPGGGADYITTVGNLNTRPSCSLATSDGHRLP